MHPNKVTHLKVTHLKKVTHHEVTHPNEVIHLNKVTHPRKELIKRVTLKSVSSKYLSADACLMQFEGSARYGCQGIFRNYEINCILY